MQPDLPVAGADCEGVIEVGALDEPDSLIEQERRLLPRRRHDYHRGLLHDQQMEQGKGREQRGLPVLFRDQEHELTRVVEVIVEELTLERQEPEPRAVL